MIRRVYAIEAASHVGWIGDVSLVREHHGQSILCYQVTAILVQPFRHHLVQVHGRVGRSCTREASKEGRWWELVRSIKA